MSEDYIPQVFFNDPEKDAEHNFYMIPDTKSGYAAIFVRWDPDDYDWYIGIISDEYPPKPFIKLEEVTSFVLDIEVIDES